MLTYSRAFGGHKSCQAVLAQYFLRFRPQIECLTSCEVKLVARFSHRRERQQVNCDLGAVGGVGKVGEGLGGKKMLGLCSRGERLASECKKTTGWWMVQREHHDVGSLWR